MVVVLSLGQVTAEGMVVSQGATALTEAILAPWVAGQAIRNAWKLVDVGHAIEHVD